MSNYTIDDVIAKMLRHADTHKTCASGAVCREFAEMLKEAWKRESEKPNSVIQAQRSEFYAEQERQRREQHGNTAKLREALLTIRANIYRDECGDLHIAPDIIVEDVIDKALAEPQNRRPKK